MNNSSPDNVKRGGKNSYKFCRGREFFFIFFRDGHASKSRPGYLTLISTSYKSLPLDYIFWKTAEYLLFFTLFGLLFPFPLRPTKTEEFHYLASPSQSKHRWCVCVCKVTLYKENRVKKKGRFARTHFCSHLPLQPFLPPSNKSFVFTTFHPLASARIVFPLRFRVINSLPWRYFLFYVRSFVKDSLRLSKYSSDLSVLIYFLAAFKFLFMTWDYSNTVDCRNFKNLSQFFGCQ